ncbi:MAG: glycosyltransferase involved in cell wall biosynthesis [Saprospiraceae bacterium]|jgi:glycosyltransferase involved in cell wall biosynthesis
MIKINAYAESSGAAWLFDDLKRHFENIRKENVEVISSNFPIENADAYIAIRTREISRSPIPAKTVVCVHDLYDEKGIYNIGGERYGVNEAGAITFCHPKQKTILKNAQIDLSDFSILERPLGALSIFSPAEAKPPKFTIAWVGRNYWRKRIDWFVEAVEKLELNKSDFRVILLGMDIAEPTMMLAQKGIECLAFQRKNFPISEYPEIYRQMSCLVITGISEAGPLTLFEALSTGIPVVSTKVGWAAFFAKQSPEIVRLVDRPEDIAKELQNIYAQKDQLFEQRITISKLVKHWTLDSWVNEVVELARALVSPGIFKLDKTR